MDGFIAAFRKFAVFSGRAGRKEYWYFSLVSFLVFVVFIVLDVVFGAFDADSGAGLLSSIYTIVVLLPALAVTVRRLHDTNRRGWWILIGLIPIVGGLLLLVFLAKQGDAQSNRFGAPEEIGTGA